MKNNTADIIKDAEYLFKNEKYDEIIALLTDTVINTIEKNEAAAELYLRRGNAWYAKEDYDSAASDYDKAIQRYPNYALAFYNRGYARGIKKEDYAKAIEDYDIAINLDPNLIEAYVGRASLLRFKKEYREAIINYDKAINIDPTFASAYFSRGLAKNESKLDLEGSRQDFEKYLQLTADRHDTWTRFARHYIDQINERINDTELSAIADLIDSIKNALLVNEDCITHYTTLSALKNLILDSSKFRISEGNFMNDPSEGMELFKFLKYKSTPSRKNDSLSGKFSPKPFIGSFVTKDKHDDLNMWRFYGKEDGVEAKGCSITLSTKEFIDDINNSLPKEGAHIDYEKDINFYWVAYLGAGNSKFHIPGPYNGGKLKTLMIDLKNKVNQYKNKNNTALERLLNSIAFLFKSAAYRNENEVRIAIKGLEFEKKYNPDAIPPRIYIELEPIKKRVKKITLGPKADKANEWASAIHHSYEINPPEIIFSHLPYK